MPSNELFGPMFTSRAMRDVTSDGAWIRRMLEAEAALARAGERAGALPPGAADAIAAACDPGRFEAASLGEAAVSAGNPVIPLVDRLRALSPPGVAGYVHFGATSQDILDTAMMLVLRDGLDWLLEGLDRVAGVVGALAARHRSTPMAGRTLLQQAVPITFGLKVAGWLEAVVAARRALQRVREERLAVQLGGAAGTLAAFDRQALEVLDYFAEELALPAPLLPWHSDRTRVAEAGAALAIAAGVMGKVAFDVALLAQTEVGEVAEPSAPGRGRSSAMAQKRNPVGAIEADAAARRAAGLAGVLLGGLRQEHERGAGAWQAEWEALSDLLALTAGAVERVAGILEGLEVREERMRENLQAEGGFIFAEAATLALGRMVGPAEARSIVDAACERAGAERCSFEDALLADATVRRHLSPEAVRALLQPDAAIGASEAFVDRTLRARGLA